MASEYRYLGWSLNIQGIWSPVEIKLGPERVADFESFLSSRGYQDLGSQAPHCSVFTNPEPPSGFRPYVVLVHLGEEPIWLEAEGFPALLRLMQELEPLDRLRIPRAAADDQILGSGATSAGRDSERSRDPTA